VFAVTGVANTIVDVAGDTLLQRAVPDEVLARAFGAVEGLTLASIALGSIAAPVLLDVLGERVTLILIGALLPIAALASWPALAAIDARAVAPTRELELLRSLPLFAPLPPATIEYLAGRLAPRSLDPGEVVIRSGERADRFYVVAAGDVEVRVDGGPPRELHAGDFFGEIGLLRGVPRTATVVAKTDAEVFELDGDDFVAAVTGHADALRAADSIVGARLALV
jgi:Cyclic nucleotide-binding domain